MAEHAVLATLKLSTGDFGSDEEVESIHDLSDQLTEAINEANAGEFDGDEFGDGQCTLYMYGPDADLLFAAVEPILRASKHAAGGYIIKRYGEASNPAAKKVRVEL